MDWQGARQGCRVCQSSGRAGRSMGAATSMGQENGAQPNSGRSGRATGIPNRDKVELRALLQERIHEYTEMRRRADLEAGMSPDDAQPIIEDYDPVVALAITAVDRRTPLEVRVRCNAEAAQYVRPKLKSVDVQVDPEALETLEQRRQLSERLARVVELIGSDQLTPRVTPRTTPPAPEGGQ